MAKKRRVAKKRRHYGRGHSERFGCLLRAWRKSAGFTLERAAKQLGLECLSPGAYLSQIEGGKRPIPERLLINVAKVYGVPAEQVLKEAYYPQLPLPLLEAVTRSAEASRHIDDILRGYEKELAEQDKEDIVRFAEFLLIRRRVAAADRTQAS